MKTTTITSKKEYHQQMVLIYELMNKGEKELTKTELKKLGELSATVEKFEDEVLKLKPKAPSSITEMVELVMFEKKMTQASLSEKLKIGKPKLSQILTGKRQPDIPFIKAIHKELNIDANFILEHI